MKITNVKAISLDVPIRNTDENSITGAVPLRSHLPMLFVRVDVDNGLSGWGEAFAMNFRDATRLVLEQTVIPRCIGREVTNSGSVTEPILREFRNSKTGLLTYAVSAIDIALWDLVAKSRGVPLVQLLGGAVKSEIPAYASLVKCSNPRAAARAALEVCGRGYRQVKLHESEYEPVAAVRTELGYAVPVMVDASSAWSVDEAVEMTEKLVRLEIAWLEEPTWPPEDYSALTQVATQTSIAIAAGENSPNISDLRALADSCAVSILQPSVCKLGGITRMREAIRCAAITDKAVVPHVYYLGPGLLASLHLMATLPGDMPVEHAIFDIEADPYSSSLVMMKGAFSPPLTPGLGLDPDPEFVSRYALP